MPKIQIGTIVTHPTVNYSMEVYEYHKVPPSDIIRLGPNQPEMVYSGKVRCKYIDNKGISHAYNLFREDELTIIG